MHLQGTTWDMGLLDEAVKLSTLPTHRCFYTACNTTFTCNIEGLKEGKGKVGARVTSRRKGVNENGNLDLDLDLGI